LRSKIIVAAVAALVTVAAGAGARHLRAERAAALPTVERADVAAELAALAAELDRIEERLLVAQGRIGFWDEMRTRHVDVSAVACENLAEHALALERREARQVAQLADAQRRRLARAPAAKVVAAGGPVEEE
jgi:hypothetical protein